MMQPNIALNQNNAISTRNGADSIGPPRPTSSGQTERYGFPSVLEQTSLSNSPTPSGPTHRDPKPQHSDARSQSTREENGAETNFEPEHSSLIVTTGQSISAQGHADHHDDADDTKIQPEQKFEETDESQSVASPDITVLFVIVSPATSTVDHEAVAIATAQSSENSGTVRPAIAKTILGSVDSAAALPSPGEGQASDPGLSRTKEPAVTASLTQSRQMLNLPQAPSSEQVVEWTDESTGASGEGDSTPKTDSLFARSTPFIAAGPVSFRIAGTGIDQGMSTSPSSGSDTASATPISPVYERQEGDPTSGGEQNDRSEFSAQTGKDPSIAPAGPAEHGFEETVLALTETPRAMGEGSVKPSSWNTFSSRDGQALTEWPKAEGHPQFLQSISLDLEPADLSPVNVRIFMTDRTVHAHIRTDHTDLGQGLLNQQHDLESNLQRSGLEMGQFKVTIDQHGHPRGDSHGLMRQQAEWLQQAGKPGSNEDDEHQVSFDPYRRSGIMSIFA